MNKYKSLFQYPHAIGFNLLFNRLATSAFLVVLGAGPAMSAPQGELDATFGENGRLITWAGWDGYGRAVVQQPTDGKLLIAGSSTWYEADGYDFTVLRLYPDGSPDDTFGTNGVVEIDLGGGSDYATDIAVQANGRIVVAGNARLSGTGYDLALVRLNSDGTTDKSFGDDGLVTLDLGGIDDYIAGITLLQDGRLVVAGASNVRGNYEPIFARFEANGILDTTFGTGPIAGTTLIDVSSDHTQLSGLIALPDGKFVACGQSGPISFDPTSASMLAVRINADGSVDTAFGSNGVSVIGTGTARGMSTSCVAMPDGTIMLGGFDGQPGKEDLLLARLLADGSLDSTFANVGMSRIDLGGAEIVQSMVRLTDGDLVVSGLSGTPADKVTPDIWSIYPVAFPIDFPSQFFFARIDSSSGLLDPSFGNNGVTLVDFGAWSRDSSAYGRDMIQQADGKLVAVGSTEDEYWGTIAAIGVARVDPAGTGNAGNAGFVKSYARASEGDTQVVATVRRTGGGSGELSVDYTTIDDTATAPSDYTTVSGTMTWMSGDMAPKIITVPITDDSDIESDEYLSIELSNSTNGIATSRFLVVLASNDAAPPQPSPPAQPAPEPQVRGGGSIGIELLVMLGLIGVIAICRRRRGKYALICRFIGVTSLLTVVLLPAMLFVAPVHGAPQGELDATFGDNGRLMLGQGLPEFDYGQAIVQQPIDGKLLIAGDNGGSNAAVIRLNSDGSLDRTFGTNGTAEVDFGGKGERLYGLALQPDGKIIVAGNVYTDLATGIPESDFALARLNPDGTNDATFGGDGRATLDLGASYEFIFGLTLLPNGQIVVAGTTDTNGDVDMAFARFNSDGSLDAAFGTGTVAGTTVVDVGGLIGPNDEPYAITRQQDGKLVACGISNTDYWDYPGTMTAVRMNPDGSLDTGFGTNGIAQIEESSWAQTCIVMSAGTIVLAGGQGSDLVFARLTSDGARDEAFADSGISRIDLGGYELVQSMILLSDGNLGVTGRLSTIRQNIYGVPTDMFFARVDPETGLLDTSFGNNGVTIVDFGFASRTAYSEGSGIIQQADGKLVAVGIAGYYDEGSIAAVARVDPEGSGNAGFAGWTYASENVAEASGAVVASVRRTGGSTGALSVDYNTVAGTAVAPSDFSATFGTLTWPNGDMNPKSVAVPITSDSSRENDQYFSIALTNSTSSLAASDMLVTITEPAPPGSPRGGPGSGSIGVDLLGLLAICAASAVRRQRIISRCVGPVRRARNTLDTVLATSYAEFCLSRTDFEICRQYFGDVCDTRR